MMKEIRESAEAICDLRPDWDIGPVMTVLLGLKDKGPWELILAAGLRAAGDPHARTPSAISFSQYWQPHRRRPTTSGPHIATPLPESACCGTPRSRNGLPPATCTCGQPWREVVHGS